MGRVKLNFFLALPTGALGRGQKIKYHLSAITKSISKILYQTLRVLTNERYKTSPGSCPKGGTLGRWGFPGSQKKFFFKHGHVAYQIDGDEEQNRMQVKFLS